MGQATISHDTNRSVATIANGSSLSDAVKLGGHAIVGLIMPAAWDAAALTFQGSTDGQTFGDVYDDATELNVGAAASRAITGAKLAQLAPFTHVKIRSGTAGAAVNQTAQRLITVVTKG